MGAVQWKGQTGHSNRIVREEKLGGGVEGGGGGIKEQEGGEQ